MRQDDTMTRKDQNAPELPGGGAAKQARPEEEARALTLYILRKHYCENDPEAILPLLDEELLWLGAGEEEWAEGGARVGEIFRRFAGRVPRCNLSGEELKVLTLAPETWLCSGRLWISTDASTGISLRVHQRVSFVFRRRSGRLLCCHIHISNPYQEMAKEDVGFPSGMASQSRQYLREQLEAQQEQFCARAAALERMSYRDALTGAYNRNKFNQAVQDQPETFSRRGIACFDLNGLKETNDHLGHSAGDDLICRAARQLRQVFGDKVYRTGGDEFVVLDTESGEEEFWAAARLARRRMEDARVSCSVGVSWRSGRGSVREQYDEADRQMYEEKRRFYSMKEHDRRRR